MRQSLELIYAHDKMVKAWIDCARMCRRAIEDMENLIRTTMDAEAKELYDKFPVDEIPERRVIRINCVHDPFGPNKRVYMSSPHIPEWHPIAERASEAENVMLETLKDHFAKHHFHQALVLTPISTPASMFETLVPNTVLPEYLLCEFYYKTLPDQATWKIDDEEVKIT